MPSIPTLADATSYGSEFAAQLSRSPGFSIACAVAKQAYVELLALSSLLLAASFGSCWVSVLPVVFLLALRAWTLFDFLQGISDSVERLQEGLQLGVIPTLDGVLPTSSDSTTAGGETTLDQITAVVPPPTNCLGLRSRSTTPNVSGLDPASLEQIVAISQAVMPSMLTPILQHVENMARENPDLFRADRPAAKVALRTPNKKLLRFEDQVD